MQWTGDSAAGFTEGKPWLPINRDFRKRNVEAQQRDPSSLLHWYRDLITLRQEEPALLDGSIEFFETGLQENVLAYVRRKAGSEVQVVLNVSGQTRPNPIRRGGTVLLSTHRKPQGTIEHDTRLAPWECTVYK